MKDLGPGQIVDVDVGVTGPLDDGCADTVEISPEFDIGTVCHIDGDVLVRVAFGIPADVVESFPELIRVIPFGAVALIVGCVVPEGDADLGTVAVAARIGSANDVRRIAAVRCGCTFIVLAVLSEHGSARQQGDNYEHPADRDMGVHDFLPLEIEWLTAEQHFPWLSGHT